MGRNRRPVPLFVTLYSYACVDCETRTHERVRPADGYPSRCPDCRTLF